MSPSIQCMVTKTTNALCFFVFSRYFSSNNIIYMTSVIRAIRNGIQVAAMSRILTPSLAVLGSRFHGEVTCTVKEAPFLKVTTYKDREQYDSLVKPLKQFLNKQQLVAGEIVQLNKEQLVHLLDQKPGSALETALFVHADSISRRFFGNKVFFRGLIEFSNICNKDCFYCGLRSSMTSLDRFTMKKEDILDAASFAMKNKYGSVMLQVCHDGLITVMMQSGEIRTRERLNFVTDIIKEIRKTTVAKDPKGTQMMGVDDDA